MEPPVKRRIFYLSGFDPRGVHFYYQLLCDNLRRYAEKTGEAVTVSRRRPISTARNDCTVENATAGVRADVTFLRWEDIVHAAWTRNPAALLAGALHTYRGFFRHIERGRGYALGRGQAIAILYPLVLGLLIPLVLALVLLPLALAVLPWWIAPVFAGAAGIALAVPLLRFIKVPWLLRFFAFNAEIGEVGLTPPLRARIDAFAADIAAALDDDDGEVLLVTHSNGSILAVPLMARLLAQRGGKMPDTFALVTLGHCIPLVAMRRDALLFNGWLRALAASEFRWIDIGSPPDGAAYYGVDPLKLVTPDPVPQVQLLSPRFHLFYDPETYHRGYVHKYEIHFDYLRVGDRVSPIDLPSIVAGRRDIASAVAAFRAIP